MRLNEQQKKKIKQLISKGTPKTQIARTMGVNVTTVYYYINPTKRIANTMRYYRKLKNHAVSISNTKTTIQK